MPKTDREKTNYPGVYFIMGKASNGRPEKIYYIMYRRDGRLIEEKVGRQYQNDMTPARAAAVRTKRIEGEASNQERRKEAKKITWTIQRLMEEYSGHKPDSKTWRTDRGRYKKYIQPSLGAKEPKLITMIEVHRLRLNLSKHLKPQTVKHVLVLLQRIVNFGVKKGLCPGLTFKPELPKVNNLKTEDLTPEQLSNLLNAIEEDYDIQAANFMKLILVTGLRRSELFKLQWQHIDFEKNFIHIVGPKGGKDQTIPMNQSARDILENHPRDNNSAFVFPGRGGKQRTDIKRPINRIRKAAGLPPDFRPLHGLRHSYASMLVSSGVDLYTLQKLLTHKTPAMTQRYAHLRDEALRRASDLASDLINKVLVNGNNHLKVIED